VLVGITIVGALAIGLFRLATFDREAKLRSQDLESLRRAALSRPNDAELYLILGQRLRQAGDLEQAYTMTTRAYDLTDGDARFAAARGGALHDAGDGESALRLLEDAVARWPESGEVRAQLSRLHLARGFYTDAQREAEAAVRMAPNHSPAWQALANASSQNKRPDAAFEAFERALELEPRDVVLLAECGEALGKYGREAEAETILTRAVALAPHVPRPAGLLGQLQARHARTTEERAAARKLLQQALDRSPRYNDARYALGLLELRDGRPAVAARHLQACLSQDPGYGEAYLALGQAFGRAGRAADARQAFAAWRRFSDYRREAAHLELRLRRTPSDVELLGRTARLHAANGKPQLAEAARRRIRALEAGKSVAEPPASSGGAAGAAQSGAP
jgi:tetratricopeptide (TPR) repeat protein